MLSGGRLIGFGGTTDVSFLPSDIANLKAWYRADQGITISTGVSQWNDLSGNAHHLTQGTGTNQPTYSATSGPNSGPGVTFDGSNDVLSVSFSAVNQPFHSFLIMKTLSTTNVSAAFLAGGAIGERLVTLGNGSNNNVSTYMGSAFDPVLTHSDTSNFYLWESLVNGASSSLKRDSSLSDTGNPGSNTLSGVTLGQLPGASYTNVVFSEVVIYSATISGTNLTNLRAYFAARYGVTTA